MALELASVSSTISEILINIGLKMTIFIHEFFGISLDASTVSLYNRDVTKHCSKQPNICDIEF